MATEPNLPSPTSSAVSSPGSTALPPVTGRVCGWLLICDPPEQTAAEIAEALETSRSAVGSAIASLENQGQILRTRAAGERADRISFHPEAAVRGLERRRSTAS